MNNPGLQSNATAEEEEDLFKVATSLRQLGRPEEAECAAQRALAAGQNLFHVHRLLGMLDRDRRQSREALAHFEDAHRLAPADVWTLVDMGQERRAIGDYPTAIDAYMAALAIKPEFAPAHRGLGFAEKARGNDAAALAHLQSALALNPNQPGAHVEIANAFRELGRPDEAEQAARTALSWEPNSTDAHRLLAFLARDRGDAPAALAHFKDAHRVAPGNIWNLFDIGQEYRGLQNYEKAVAAYGAALDIKHDHVPALRGLALTERARGNDAAALTHLRAAAAIDPNHIVNGIDIAATMLKLGEIDAAAAIAAKLDLSALQTSEAIEARRLLSQIAHAQRDVAGEISHLRAIVELRPEAWQGWGVLINRLVASGRLRDALRVVKQAASVLPDDPDLLLARARVLRLLGRKAESVHCVETLRGRADLSVMTAGKLVAELRSLGLPDMAAQEAERILDREPQNIDVLMALAHLRIATQGPNAGLAILRKVLELSPGNLEARCRIAQNLRETGDVSASRQFLAEQGEDAVSQPRLFEQYMLSLSADGDMAAARQLLQKRRDFHGDDIHAVLAEIDLEFARGNIKRLKLLVPDALARFKGDPAVLSRALGIAQAAQDHEAVIDLQRRLVRIEPLREMHARIAIAQAQFRLGRREQADRTLTAVQRQFAHYPEPDLCAALFALWRGEPGKHLDILRGTSAAFPDHVSARVQFVKACIQVGAWDEAEATLAPEPDGDRNWRESRPMLEIELALESRQLDRAIELIEAYAPDTDGRRSHYHDVAARAYLHICDIDAAKRHLRSAVPIQQAARRMRGQGINASQSLHGQLVDEYSFDGPLLAQIRSIMRRPSDRRLSELLTLTRSNPESTAVAITAALQLRMQRAYARASATGEFNIPRRIAQFWDNPKPPSDILEMMETWKTLHPTWEYSLFNEVSALAFLNENCQPNVAAAFRKAQEPTFKADLFRLGWLSSFGGFYADADDICTGGFEDLVGPQTTFFGYQEDIGSIGNNMMGATKGHPIVTWALDEAATAIVRGDADMVWLATGPGLLTRSFIRHLAIGDGDLTAALSRLQILDHTELHRICSAHRPASYKQTSLHWSKKLFG